MYFALNGRPYVVSFNASAYTCDVAVIPCCMNSTITTHFLSCPKKQLLSAFWQADDIFLTFSRIVWWICLHPLLSLLSLLFAFNIYKWELGFIICYLYDVIEKFIAIFKVSFQILKAEENHSLRFVCTRGHYRNPYCAKLVIVSPNWRWSHREQSVKLVKIHCTKVLK
jgi:hypothetical protein